MSTIEGGMVCTNDDKHYDLLRAFRSHGMLRECKDQTFKECVTHAHEDLNPDFIFLSPAYNFRSTELNAVLGISQLKNLDDNNKKRVDNFDFFMSNLNDTKYITNLNRTGQCNYAFIVILRKPDIEERNNIEFRRGLSGGGNQLRQPYIERYGFDVSDEKLASQFANVDHVHNYSWYIGNYPSLEREKITNLLTLLNEQ